MNVPKIVNAMGHIDDDLVAEATEYKPTKRHFFLRTKWTAIAACFVLVAVVMGIFPLFNQPETSPFVLTAYAAGTDNEVVGNVMELGKSIPISTINTSTEKKCFVFSCDKSNYEADSSITILMKHNLFNEAIVPAVEYSGYDISEFEEFVTDPTQHYFIAILGDQNAGIADMYSFPLYIGDSADKGEQQKYTILVMKNENGYAALLADVSEYNRKSAD